MNEMQQPVPANHPGNSRLLLFFLCTFVATVVTTVTAMMMALGTGLSSSPDEPVSGAAQVLWAIGGLSFIPCTILVVVLIGTHKRTVGIALALTVIVAGLFTALGWFIDSGGTMPGTIVGDVLVILVMVISLLAGGLMLWQSNRLEAGRR